MTDIKFNPTPQNAKDITGQKFNEWTVLGYSHKKVYSRSPRRFWVCQCSCGTIRPVDEKNLVFGRSTACGCTRKTTQTHGMSNTATYNSWRGMLERCNSPSHSSYHNYGGRGIAVCPEWKSFESFLEDMGECPSNSHSIDRIDNDGNYEPGNCQWVTQTEQGNNTRANHVITFSGKTMTMKQWANETGIKYSTLAARLNILGWSIERSLTKPVK